MLDIKQLRDDPEGVKAALARRGETPDLGAILDLDQQRRGTLHEMEQLRAEQNRASQEIAAKKKAKEDASTAIAAMRGVSERIKELDETTRTLDTELRAALLGIPNLPHETAPTGHGEEDNPVVRQVGTPPPFDFEAKDHVDLGTALGILDFERAAKIAGARFTLSIGAGAHLERALTQFMLDLHTREHGYVEVLPPFIANVDSFTGTGQLPKFAEDQFKLAGFDYYLIPTAEVPVTNIHRDEILAAEQLPIAYAAYTPCFRSEAGSYGRDTRGMIRQHQFNKVELVHFCLPEDSMAQLETLTANAERVLQLLDLPYQVVERCTGDLGFSGAKGYDIEVWLPGQQRYREISSCTNFWDFQARRANIRFRREKKPEFVHTLNGSGLAVGRTLVAVLENHQQADGTVVVPEALRPYMNGLERITPRE